MNAGFIQSLRPRTLPPIHVSGIKSYAPLRYEKEIREWIQTLKFQLCLNKSNHLLLNRLAEFIAPEIGNSYSGIVAVPSHPLRCLSQVDLSWEWALVLSKTLKIPLIQKLLLPPTYLEALFIDPQKNLSPQERYQRSSKIQRFRVSHQCEHIHKTRLLLVDDVVNTGHSVREAMKLLQHAGHHVEAACFLAVTPQAELYD